MPRLRFGLVVAFAACLHLIAVTQVEAACTGNPSSTCNSTQCCYEDIPDILGIGGDIVPDQNCYDSEKIIDYVCNGDLAGPPFNKCVGGAWSFGVGPTCTADVQCPQPTVPTYGAISPNQTEYEKYTTITYSCNSGFTLTGPQQSTCESDGTWNPTTTPTCDANCNRPTISNGEISPNKSSYVNGEVINYSCDTNYTLVGITSTTCRDGAFDPSSVPNCYEKCNPPVVANSNYDTQQGLVEHGSTIEIICDIQYSTGTGTETDLRCTDGNFDDDDPVCYENCNPPTIKNGEISPNKSSYVNGEGINYSCDTNYTLVGISSTTCRDGAFDPSGVPNCYGKCKPPVVANSNYDTHQGLVEHGSTITITCDTQYSTGTGTDTDLRCTDGDFDDDDPVCFAQTTQTVDMSTVYDAVTPTNGPGASVSCESTSMTAFLDRGLLENNGTASDVHFEDLGCVAYNYDAARIAITTRYNDCQTKFEQTDTVIKYSNEVTYSKPNGDDGTVITRTFRFKIPVVCELNRRSLLGSSFKPKLGVISFSEIGYGNFSLSLDRYDDGTFSAATADPEAEVYLGKSIYFAANLTAVTDLTLLLDGCWATPDVYPMNPTSYTFIKDGCNMDSTVVRYDNLGTLIKGFSVEAFAFIGEHPEVYIHCDVLVCDNSDLSSRCSQGCMSSNTNRARRSAASPRGSSSKPHTVSNGPLSDHHALTSSSEDSSWLSSPVNMMLVGATGFLVAMVAMVTVRKVMSRRESRDKGYSRLQAEEA